MRKNGLGFEVNAGRSSKRRLRRPRLAAAVAVLGVLASATAFASCEFPGQNLQNIANQVSWGSTNVPASNCTDGVRTRVYSPVMGGVSYELSPSNCNPVTQTCTVVARVGVAVPGNSQNSQSFDSTVKVLWFNSSSTSVGTCGNIGAPIGADEFDATMSIGGFTCGGTLGGGAGVYSVEARLTKCFSSSAYFSDSTSFELTQPNLEAIFCNAPKKPYECNCMDNPAGGGPAAIGGGSPPPKSRGGAGGGSLNVTGLGASATPPDQAGAVLNYQAGGAGFWGTPSFAAWSATLGRGWSHEFAERIFKDPDEEHVWLVTRNATFREFDDLDAGGGLRKYQTRLPSDEYRSLYYDTGTGGWQLHDLAGTVASFNSAGLWQSTVDRNGNTWSAFSYSGSQITRVDMPDGQRDEFTYLNGKLRKIIRRGTDGTSTRTWVYTWAGKDLARIDLPDGRSVVLKYGDVRSAMTRMTLVPDNDGNAATPAMGTAIRVLRGWRYDTHGNADATWVGAAAISDTAAVEKWSLIFDDPDDPTESTLTDPLAQESVYTFDRDPSGSDKARILSVTGGCPTCGSGPNSVWEFTDSANPMRPTRVTDGRGIETEYTWDANGQMTSRVDAANNPNSDPDLPRTTTWTYDTNFPSFPTSIDGPFSGVSGTRVVAMIYDSATGDLQSRTISGAEATYSGGTFSLTTDYPDYNAAGRPETIDPPGYSTTDQTTFTYAVSGTNGQVPDSRTDPLVGTTNYAYDVYNRRTRVTDVNSVKTDTEYDAVDHVTRVIQRGSNDSVETDDLITLYKYNDKGDLFCVKRPAGDGTQYGYDAAGRLTEVRRGLAVATPSATSCLSISSTNFAERLLYTLDGGGHRTNEKRERGTSTSSWTTHSETSYVYSTMCHLDKTIQAPGKTEESVTEYDYDCGGNLASVWDPNHLRASFPSQPSTAYSYDALNRLAEVTQPWGGAGGGSVATTYFYDVQDHLVEVIDGNGTSTNYTYSDRDLMTEQVSEVSGTASYAYNEHGELVQETDGRGVTTDRTVDEADRVTLVDLPGTVLDVTYSYGSTPASFDVGRLTGVTRNAGTVAYAYDRFGRTLTDGALTYTYDGNSNPLTITYPGSLQAIYTYDKMDRPITLQSKEGAATAVYVVKNSPLATYRAYGPLSTLRFDLATDRDETRAYDFRNQPTSITVSGSLFTLNYTTDDVGNITQQQRTLPAPTETRGYSYQDWQYYLTCGSGPWGGTACSPSPSGNPLQWTYDKIGNRATELRAGLTDGYVYDPNSGATGDTAVLDVVNLGVMGTRDYTFDAGGYLNQIAAGANVLDFTFDDAGQLAEVERTAASQDLTMSYDGRGFLAEADDAASGGSVKATYSSGGLLHYSLERKPTSVATVERHNVLYFAGRPIAIWKKVGAAAATTTYLVTDHLGTPVYALNQAGTEYWKGGLEPFGRDWQEGTANDMLTKGIFLRFPGQWDDGLFTNATLGGDSYYNVRRWYETQGGKYAASDPMGLRGGLNLFDYAKARPTKNVDVLGLVWHAKDCNSCCTDSERKRELQEMTSYATSNLQKFNSYSLGCGDSSRGLADDLNRGVGIKCWVVRDQLVSGWLFGVGVHSVVRIRPCGSRVISRDTYMDLWKDWYSDPVINPESFQQEFGGRELDSEDIFDDPSKMPSCSRRP
ncbi:MAG: RHS repeat-associated core domain-containing protein [Thermoanaerobaculia bacterium]